MTEADKQQAALDVLKSLNAAVNTTKLYPPSFPQVAAAEENAFERTTAFLSKFGTISFSLVDDEPKLCGLPISQKTLGKMHGEDIFQQLRLLRLNHVLLEKDITRKLFLQLLIFFTTSPQLVNREGGGRSFVVNLGLNDLFPEQCTFDIPQEREDLFASVFSQLRSEERAGVEHIHSISTEINAETAIGQKRISSLAALKGQPRRLVDLIIAAISESLQGMQRSGSIIFPPTFGTVLLNVDRITDESEWEDLAKATAAEAIRCFDDFGLHNLLLQPFPRGFGVRLYENLIAAVTSNIDAVIELMKEEQEVVGESSGVDSDRYRQVSRGLEHLLSTGKGKQYLVREKAKKLLEVGEKERQTKRLQMGISGILKGDLSKLKHKEVVAHLPFTVESLLSHGKDKTAATLIEKITTEVVKGDAATRAMLSESLILIGERLVNSEKWGWLERISIPLLAWVKEVNRADEVYEKTIEILVKLQKYYWRNKKDNKADKILQLFFAIRTGNLKKSKEVVAMLGKVQDLSIDKAPLPKLLARSVEEKDDLIDRRLIMQGPISCRFLINSLFESEKAEVRLKVIELLHRTGPLLPPLLLAKLAEPMPWFAKRNLLKLLSGCGSEKDVPQIVDYLNHEDIRVQKEAFNCIFKLSGEDRKSNLLEALSIASGPMKEQVVRALIPLVDQQVVMEIINLLEDWKHFPEEVQEPLLIQLFTIMGKVPFKEAEMAIEDFLKLEGKGKSQNIGPHVWLSAKQSLKQIKLMQREQSRKLRQEMALAEQENDEKGVEKKSMDQTSRRRSSYPEEAHVQSRLQQSDLQGAKKLLVELIEKAAGAKRFPEAERLREWLIEIDPSALNDIIRSAETIESYKSEGISSDYLQIWAELNDNLSTEEFNALFYAMEHMTCNEEDILVKQGDERPALFFVNHGKVKIYFLDKNREVFVKNIMPGEIFGGETFFDASVWTISAAALSKCEISELPLRNSLNWSNEYPALESKLQDFTGKYENIADFIKVQHNSRREHKRHQTTGDVIANILEQDGKDTGVQMKGELADVSRGGLSFLVRITRKKNARILLGRKIRVQLPSSTARGKMLTADGVMMSVRSLYSMTNEYSAHVKLNKHLTDQEINSVVEACKVT